MEQLSDLLAGLPVRHRSALQWFMDHRGTNQPWPKPLPDGTLLASKAKGIYKPNWTRYALSVRQSLSSPYPDREPVVRSDGTWSYLYFQETDEPEARDSAYTNRGLIACLEDRVPVGVIRQVSGKPRASYHVLGLAVVVGWEGGYFLLEGFGPTGQAHGSAAAAVEVAVLGRAQENLAVSTGIFDPGTIVDGRVRIIATIVRRRGQPEFRRRLLEAYGGRCAITGCEAVEALEAAHIVPYRGPETHHLSNGLLLRADIHTLFDLGLLAIDSATMVVLLAPSLATTSYKELDGKRLQLPKDDSSKPAQEALDQHRDWSGL